MRPVSKGRPGHETMSLLISFILYTGIRVNIAHGTQRFQTVVVVLRKRNACFFKTAFELERIFENLKIMF